MLDKVPTPSSPREDGLTGRGGLKGSSCGGVGSSMSQPARTGSWSNFCEALSNCSFVNAGTFCRLLGLLPLEGVPHRSGVQLPLGALLLPLLAPEGSLKQRLFSRGGRSSVSEVPHVRPILRLLLPAMELLLTSCVWAISGISGAAGQLDCHEA
jgi:hypothetical protein